MSAAGARAALGEAIEAARRAGELTLVARVADTPGFRRRLRGRIAAWTRGELDPEGEPPREGGAVALEEWAVFGRYRALLNRLGAEDAEAFAVWASRTLRDEAPPDLRRFGYVAVLDPAAMGRAPWRAIEHFCERSAGVLVTLPFDPEASRAEAFAAAAPIRDRLLDLKFVELAFPEESTRPPALSAIERELFRDDAHMRPPLEDVEGLRILGAPDGEGAGMVLAREVRARLDAGCAAEDVLVLFPRWDERAAVARDALRAWGIPAAVEAGEALAAEPSVAALRLAMMIPVEGWEAAGLVRLLRNGRLRPDWPAAHAPMARASAAAAIRDTRVFRGADAIRDALRRASGSGEGTAEQDRERRERARRAREALAIVDPLIEALRAADRPGPWRVQVERLRRLAGVLGLGSDEPTSLEHLDNALDDHGAVLDGLGRGREEWSWPEFAREVEALARELPAPPAPISSGAVRLATVEAAEGLRAKHVVLAALAEGTFPAREAVEPDPGAPEGGADDVAPVDAVDLAYPRELLRFLRVVGSADESLTLIYPTTDEKGQALLPAGFLDDLRRLFRDDAWVTCTAEIRRLDPVPPSDLAGAPADARVRALALALEPNRKERKLDDLSRLARTAAHRGPLEGAAEALRVAHRRLRRAEFGPHEGRLADAKAVRRIAGSFGPDRPAFSPSQLESLAFCPFQFFLRYVLRLEPTDERDELDDDRTARGHMLHRALEALHTLLRDQPPDGAEGPAERVAGNVESVIAGLLEQEGTPGSDVDAGLRRIERERLLRAGRRYAGQFARYFAAEGAEAEAHLFEVAFGRAEESEHPALVIGPEPEAIELQGKIDRIDLVRSRGETLFRVIDYKSGSCPGRAEIDGGLALQLPLYALAAERIVRAELGAKPLDMGYWALRGRGFQKVKAMTTLGDGGVGVADGWEPYRGALEAFLLDLVARLRQGAFPIHPRSDDCTRICDYRGVCRIAQVRSVGKAWADAPRMGAGP
jgi:hypothetical protein